MLERDSTFDCRLGEDAKVLPMMDHNIRQEIKINPESKWMGVSQRRAWVKAEEDILRDYFGRVTMFQISIILKERFPPGRTTAAIRVHASELGLHQGDSERYIERLP